MFNKAKIKKLEKEIESLKEQNEKLKDTVVESVDLVSAFRRAADEMNKFVNELMNKLPNLK